MGALLSLQSFRLKALIGNAHDVIFPLHFEEDLHVKVVTQFRHAIYPSHLMVGRMGRYFRNVRWKISQ